MNLIEGWVSVPGAGSRCQREVMKAVVRVARVMAKVPPLQLRAPMPKGCQASVGRGAPCAEGLWVQRSGLKPSGLWCWPGSCWMRWGL